MCCFIKHWLPISIILPAFIAHDSSKKNFLSLTLPWNESELERQDQLLILSLCLLTNLLWVGVQATSEVTRFFCVSLWTLGFLYIWLFASTVLRSSVFSSSGAAWAEPSVSSGGLMRFGASRAAESARVDAKRVVSEPHVRKVFQAGWAGQLYCAWSNRRARFQWAAVDAATGRSPVVVIRGMLRGKYKLQWVSVDCNCKEFYC